MPTPAEPDPASPAAAPGLEASGAAASVSLPSGSVPSCSVPSGSVPSGSVPSGSVASGSVTSGSIPPNGISYGGITSGTVPSGTIPSGSAPPTIAQAAHQFAAGAYQAAADTCHGIIADDPCHFDALHLLGVVLSRLDRPAEALSFLIRAQAVRAGNAQLQTNLCNALLALQRHQDALAPAQEAVRLAPDDASAWNNLGLVHKGLSLKPPDPAGTSEQRLQQNAAAVAAFRRAIALRWDHAPALFNLGVVLNAANRPQEALDVLRQAERVAPLDTPMARLADICNETGRSHLALGDPDAAIAACRRFLRRHPDSPSVRWNLSLALLLTGRFREGWALYENRWHVPGHDPPPEGASVIDPGRVAGRRLLILTEQGRGDMIQFVRYAPLLAAAGATVFVQAYPDLLPLLATLPGIAGVIGLDDAPPPVDDRIPVMSLPLAFDTDLSSIPASVPYLSAPPARLAAWRQRLGPPARRRIGLAWSGSVHSQARSAMPVAQLAPLLTLPGVDWHCLQTEISATDRTWLAAAGSPVRLHDAALADFADTAALMACLDAVVTIDTAVAHLAGALALPVTIMLPFTPDFRWLLHRDSSPWYPTARLVRQPRPGDWDSVVAEVAGRM